MYLRTAVEADFKFLVDVLLQAFNWSGHRDFSRDQVLDTPEICHYVTGWKRDSDFGTVACADEGQPIGAAWARFFGVDDKGYGFVAEHVPELTIGVLPGHRGAGVGTELMAALIRQATGLHTPALSLSVEDRNPAVRLYERNGFRAVGRTGASDIMLLPLSPA